MSSAQLDPRHSLEPETQDGDAAFALTEYPALKQEVAARLAAHRARRQRNAPAAPAPIPIATTPARARAAKIAAAVAERYAHSESYREFLASEAESAIRQAEAAAEVAAVTARAVAEAQLNLLEELDQYKQDTTSTQEAAFRQDPASRQDLAGTELAATQPTLASKRQHAAPAFEVHPAEREAAARAGDLPFQAEAESAGWHAPQHRVAHDPQPNGAGQVTVRMYEQVAVTVPQPFTTSHLSITLDPLDEEALDDEIAFRQAPTFVETSAAAEIPANLIEFPRQLVAARKARPRLAEGPLREEGDHAGDPAQLRIFEVEPTQISATPAAASEAPEWSSILLGAQPVIASTLVEAEEPATLKTALHPMLMTAPLELRVMATAVDTAIVLGAMLSFTAVAAFAAGAVPAPHLQVPTHFAGIAPFAMAALPGVLAAAFIFLFLMTLYQCLFFTFSDATPGMRYARIGLCTFSDENPTRAQMRRRIPATLLSVLPLGLGLVWSWIDADRIGWHDRMSRTYQRSY